MNTSSSDSTSDTSAIKLRRAGRSRRSTNMTVLPVGDTSCIAWHGGPDLDKLDPEQRMAALRKYIGQ